MQPKTTLVSLDIIFLTYPPLPLLLFLLLFLKLDSSPPLNSLNVCLSGTLCTVFLSNFVVLIFNDVLHNYNFFYPPFCHSSRHQCSWRWVSWSFVCSLRSFRVYFSVSLLLDICLWSQLLCLLIAETFLIDVAELDDSAIDTCMIFPVPDLTTVTNTNAEVITPVTKMVTIFSVSQYLRDFF